jgi:cation transport regulator
VPYSKDSPPERIKALPDHAKDIWIAAFNSAHEQYKDEGKANATAWAAVENKYKKNEKGEWVAKESMVPPDETLLAKGVEVVEISCPVCHGDRFDEVEGGHLKCCVCGQLVEASKAVEDLQRAYSRLIALASTRNAVIFALKLQEVGEAISKALNSPSVNQTVAISTLVHALTNEIKALELVRIEEGLAFPARAYAYRPDAEKPETWQLRLIETPTGAISRPLLNKAAAYVSPGGFKGVHVVSKDDLPQVRRVLRDAFRADGVAEENMPKWVQEVNMERALINEFIPLEEGAVIDKGNAQIVVIKPGLNASKARYYPSEMLARDFKVFEGVKMYADHPTPTEEKEKPERSVRDWVATLKNVHVGKDGAVLGEAVVVEPWMQAKLATLRDKNMLAEMGVSINAIGTGSKGKVEGVDTSIIERIVRARSVDFVTEAGAGGGIVVYESNGHVDTLAPDIDLVSLDVLKEHRPDLVKELESAVRAEITKEVKHMGELEDKVKALETTVTDVTKERDDLKAQIAEAAKARAIAETATKLNEVVVKSNLPEPARLRILAQFKDAQTDAGIDEAIKAEVAYIASLTEAGKVKGLGGTQTPPAVTVEAMKESWRKLRPDWTDAQIDQAISRK